MSTFSKGFVFGGQFIRIRADCQVSFYLILIIRKKIIAKDYQAKNLDKSLGHLAGSLPSLFGLHIVDSPCFRFVITDAKITFKVRDIIFFFFSEINHRQNK